MARAPLLAAAALAAAAGARGQECALALAHPPRPAASPPAAAPSPEPVIRSIRFAGQREVGADSLRARMEMKEARFWRGAGRSAWSQRRWEEDHHRLCELYREGGFVTASVGPPEVATTGRPGGAAEVRVRIPVHEGPRHDTGRVEVAGVTTADDPGALFELPPGGVYRQDRVQAGLEALRRAAGRRGHATWSARVVLAPRAGTGERPLVDVAVQVMEGPPWFVGRVAFRGARTTRDGTLRRAVTLNEGALLDTDRLEESVRRLEALGYVRLRAVEVVPSPRAEGSADVTFTVEERPPFRYGVSGGINALEGASAAGELGAVNAFGRGERLFASFQLGQDVRAYDVSLSAPHVFGSAWTAGAQARAHRLDLEGVPGGGVPPHKREADGFGLFMNRALGRRAGAGFDYSLSDVTLTAEVDPQPAGFGARRDGRLALWLRHDGWDHHWKPRRGLRADGVLRAWGGPLGGPADALEVRARVFGLVPLGRRAAVGLGAQGGVILSGQDLGELPFDERYLLGGEADLRGFDARTVGPRDAAGTVVPGTRQAVVHGEAHLDLPRGLRALAFVDAGNAWAEGTGGFHPRISTGLELRFELPLLRLPLRLMGVLNPVRDPYHPRTSFHVALGPVP